MADLLFVRTKPPSEFSRKVKQEESFCVLLGAGVGVTAFILMVAATDLPGPATAFE